MNNSIGQQQRMSSSGSSLKEPNLHESYSQALHSQGKLAHACMPVHQSYLLRLHAYLGVMASPWAQHPQLLRLHAYLVSKGIAMAQQSINLIQGDFVATFDVCQVGERPAAAR